MRSAALLILVAAACQPIDRAAVPTASPTPVFAATVTPASLPPVVASASVVAPTKAPQTLAITEFKVGAGQGPHDVAPAVDGGVWYTAQRTGELGYLDPKTGAYRMTKLGNGSAPHGVIVGPDGNPWITDGGLNAIVRVDAKTNEVTRFPLPGPNVNLNTAAFDRFGMIWFTGQSGYFGFVHPGTGAVRVVAAPRGAGPYGITNASHGDGNIYYASLAGSHIAFVDIKDVTAAPIDPPTKNQGARRIWEDSGGSLWVSEWNAGQVGRFTPSTKQWKEWKLPGANPMAYAVYVDDQDIVWLTDFGANALVRFDPKTETFTVLPHSAPNAAVRQLLGRPGEVWGAMSGQDKLLVVRTR
ncbi:MAG TPA: lyase [Candidatus Limnocylindria bacterium]|jgi:virginiamycin B lyase